MGKLFKGGTLFKRGILIKEIWYVNFFWFVINHRTDSYQKTSYTQFEISLTLLPSMQLSAIFELLKQVKEKKNL
jgi:hypothetical protein